MPSLDQKLVPGIVGISTYVDCAYQTELHQAAAALAGSDGPINQLRAVTVTLDFKALLANLQAGRLDEAEDQVAVTAEALQAAGADFILVTSGTTSTLTGRARARVSIPFLDLADAAWAEVPETTTKVGLLSTRHAASGGLFQAAAERHGGMLVLPDGDMAARVDTAIFDELVRGVVTDAAVRTLTEAVATLASQGAGAVILGNTDMTLAADRLRAASQVPLIDSARAHARAAARAALDGRL